MKYQMATYGGESILLSDQQYERVVQAWDSGAQEFSINNQRIPRKAISYIGYTPSASEEQRIEEQNYYLSLSQEEQDKLKKEKFQYALEQSKKIVAQKLESGEKHTRNWLGLGGKKIGVDISKEENLPLPMSEAQSEQGDAEFYIKDGIKHYS